METIKELFKNHGVELKSYSSNPVLDKGIFPKELVWMHEFLCLIPFYEQTERESYMENLPGSLATLLNNRLIEHNDILMEWLTSVADDGKERYYATLIYELLELKCMDLYREESFKTDMLYFQNTSDAIIQSNEELTKRYLKNSELLEIPERLVYFKPMLCIVDEGQSVEDFLKNTPSDLVDIMSRMMRRGSDYLEDYAKVNNQNAVLLKRIDFLSNASSNYFTSFFSVEW